MYIGTLDKRNSKIFVYENLSLASSSFIFGTVRDFSYVAEGFDQLINDRVDFSPVSFYRAVNYNWVSLEM